MRNVYLDYNASTPIAPEVKAAMLPWLDGRFGNPSSSHWASAEARPALEEARTQVARLLQCEAEEVVFTSGGTEANNHAIKGAYFSRRSRGNQIVTTQVEHPAVSQPCAFLESLGAEVTRLPVDGYGRVDPEDVKRAITPQTILVSVMHANNEVGTLQPIAEIARHTRERGVLLHTDAAQSAGKIATNVEELGVDLLSVAGHKLYAPKGVGALFIRRGVELSPLFHGAGHESGRRAGTESVLLNVALGAACQLALHEPESARREMTHLCGRFQKALENRFGGRMRLNGHPSERLPNTLNLSIEGVTGSELLAMLPGVAASTGSACHSGRREPSAVLKAMGIDDATAHGAVRFSLGRATTTEELDHVVELMAAAVESSSAPS